MTKSNIRPFRRPVSGLRRRDPDRRPDIYCGHPFRQPRLRGSLGFAGGADEEPSQRTSWSPAPDGPTGPACPSALEPVPTAPTPLRTRGRRSGTTHLVRRPSGVATPLARAAAGASGHPRTCAAPVPETGCPRSSESSAGRGS